MCSVGDWAKDKFLHRIRVRAQQGEAQLSPACSWGIPSWEACKEAGHHNVVQVPVVCEAEAELAHRLWFCPGLAALLEKHMPPGAVQWAKAGGHTTLLATACIGALLHKS